MFNLEKRKVVTTPRKSEHIAKLLGTASKPSNGQLEAFELEPLFPLKPPHQM
jgi:hypothetical protein